MSKAGLRGYLGRQLGHLKKKKLNIPPHPTAVSFTMHVYVKRSLQACVHHMTFQIGFKPQYMSRGPSLCGAHGPVIRAIFKFVCFFSKINIGALID